MGCHPSHVTRVSIDASSYDEICVNCGATDKCIGGWGELAKPCPNPPKPPPEEHMDGSVEHRLEEWRLQAPVVCKVTSAERQFIRHMREAALDGVGYGWMKQIIDWEWDFVSPGTNPGTPPKEAAPVSMEKISAEKTLLLYGINTLVLRTERKEDDSLCGCYTKCVVELNDVEVHSHLVSGPEHVQDAQFWLNGLERSLKDAHCETYDEVEGE